MRLLLRWLWGLWYRVPPGHPIELHRTLRGKAPEEDTGLRFPPEK
jgi:hypothetical protein